MSDIIEITTAGEWFELVFARCSSGFLNLYAIDRGTNVSHSEWAPATDPRMLGDYAEALAGRCDVWFGVAPRKERRPGKKRGGKEHCVLLPALVADVDVVGPRHKKNENLPLSMEDAKALILQFPVRPSALVYTGGGIQPYWFLRDPLMAEEAKVALARWECWWQQLGEKESIHFDSVFSLEHIFRVPGTFNRKVEPVVPVTAQAYHDRVYAFAEIDDHLVDPRPRTDRGTADYGAKGCWNGGARPGDVFNAIHGAGEVLRVRGFGLARSEVGGDEHWKWPDSESATSATVYAEDGHVTIWSETFVHQFPAAEVRRPYDPFGLLAVCFFDGDFVRTHSALIDQGYGVEDIDDLSWIGAEPDGSGAQPNENEGESMEWPAPIPLTGPESGPPFDVNWLPRVVRDHVVELSRETQTPAAMAAFFDLGVLGTVLAKKVRVRIFGGWSEPPTIYSCVVAAVGERKTAVHEAATAPLDTLEAELLADWEATKAEREAERARLRTAGAKVEAAAVEIPPEPRLVAADATMEALAPLMKNNGGRMALITDEGASVFEILAGRYSEKPSIELFLKGHDGTGTARIDRVDRNIVIRRPLLTCVLAIQPNVLTSVTSTMLGRGAPARFLYAVTATAKGRRDLRPQPMRPAVAEAWSNLVVHLGRLKTPTLERTVELSPEATEVFHEFRRWHEHESRPDGRLELVDDWATKLPGAVARLALLLHVAGRRPDDLDLIPPVSGEAMRSAVAMADHLLCHAEVAYGCFDANATVRLARRIVGWLRRNPRDRFHRREACMATRKPVEEIVPALQLLAEHEVLRAVIDPKSRLRPPKEPMEYLVSPRLDELVVRRTEEDPPPSTSSISSTNAGEAAEDVEENEHVEGGRGCDESDPVEGIEDVEGGPPFEAQEGPEVDLSDHSRNGSTANGSRSDDATREKGFV